MQSYKPTDEELVELAKLCDENSDEDTWDINYYQQTFSIVDGDFRLLATHLYSHYKKWSLGAVNFEEFFNLLKLQKKVRGEVFINREVCTIDILKVIGEYVQEQKKIKKEERLRKISGTKSKAQRQD